MNTNGAIVSARNLSKSYNSNLVLSGLNLELAGGHFYALLGKNGSGKSTLMRILAHREAATGGEADVLGVSLEKDFCDKGNEVAYVAEGLGFEYGIYVTTLFDVYRASFSSWDESTFQRLVAALKFNTSKTIGEYSRGQLVQLSLILALSYNPKLILLDEITSVLDANIRHIVMQELQRRVDKGATVVLATNIVTEVQHRADTLVLIGRRKVQLVANVKDLSASFIKLAHDAAKSLSPSEQENIVEVGMSDDGTPTFLMSRAHAQNLKSRPDELDGATITPHEIFIYLSQVKE